MSRFYVTVDTGDGYDHHAETWPVELTLHEKELLAKELAALKAANTIEAFTIKIEPWNYAFRGLSSLRPRMLAWIKANPKDRLFGDQRDR